MAHTVDSFYEQLWQSDEWGNREINLDEQVRSQKIKELIEKFVLPNVKDKKKMKIVDVGCGRGWLTSRLTTYGDVIGIDPTLPAIERGKELFPECQFICTNTQGLRDKVGSAYFDLVISSEVIEHIDNEHKLEFLKSIYELLNDNGYAIITTPRGELWNDWKRLGKEEQPIEQWISESRLAQLSKSLGFSVVKSDRIYLPYFRYNFVSRVLASKRFSFLKKIRALRYYCGLYQVILLRRGI